MPCFLLLIILLSPRIALVLLWLFSNYLQPAFHGRMILPLLGFFFLPFTTLVYAWEVHDGMPRTGLNLVFLAIALLVDLSGAGGGAHRQTRRN